MDIGPVPVSFYAPAAAQEAGSQVRPEDRQLIQAVKALNASELFGQNAELTFVLDRETHRPLVRIIDRETKEVIRQIPPEYALRLAEDLKLDI